MRQATARLAVLLAVPVAAQAHSFGRVLTLPVPLWLYLYGSAAALVLSFFVLGMQGARPARPAAVVSPVRQAGILDWVGVALMLLAIASALAGSLNPYRNFSMTWFWIVFLLGGLYASAIAGTRVAWINPWRTLLLAMERRWPRAQAPAGTVAAWPALALYVALIALELFGHGSPRTLGAALVAYTVLTVACALAFGPRAWLERGEFFERYFGVGSQVAPSRQAPLPAHVPVLLFVLFMLSSTAFDGLKETVLWNSLYWQGLAPSFAPAFGGNVARAYLQLSAVQDAINFVALLLSPLVYLALCTLALAASRALMPAGLRAGAPLSSTLVTLTRSLVPIAVAYNAAHYFSLLVGQGSRTPALLLDPLGWSTGAIPRLPALSPLATWHVQVGLILAGHVAGIAWCHRDLWVPGLSRARNWLVQAPMLVLMVLLTASGLWILSLPVNPSRAL